jgi:hypothetical protein
MPSDQALGAFEKDLNSGWEFEKYYGFCSANYP